MTSLIPELKQANKLFPILKKAGNSVRSFTSLVSVLLLLTTTVEAAPGKRIIATGGATTIEGSAGGGLVPWAVLSGYGQSQEIGGAIAATNVKLPDYSLNSFSVASSLKNRLELSFNHQSMDINSVSSGEKLEQNTLGLKVRIIGELIYTQLPQISLGVQFKQNDSFSIPESAGASDDSGVDVYLAASKLWLSGVFNRSTFLNGTVRATRANQIGLLGFGGDANDDYALVGEVSAGLFLNRNWVLGVEYRQKPDNLSLAREDDWYDAFVGWFPNKRGSVVAAWSRLGSIAGFDDQDSIYLSLQLCQ